MCAVNNAAVPGLKKAENFGAAFQSVSSTSVVVRFGRLHSSGLFGWCYRMSTLHFAAAAADFDHTTSVSYFGSYHYSTEDAHTQCSMVGSVRCGFVIPNSFDLYLTCREF